MGLIYMPEVESGVLRFGTQSPDTELSAISRIMPTANRPLSQGLKITRSATRQSGMMSERSTESPGLEKWISYLPDSHANHSLWLENGRGRPMIEISGLTPSDSLAKYDPVTHSWRTSQGCLFSDTLELFSGTWPKSGMIVNGCLYQLPKSERPIEENVNGYWRTPDTGEGGRSGLLTKGIDKRQSGESIQVRLVDQVNNSRLWPTPRYRDFKGMSQRGLHKPNDALPNAVGPGPLNPRWIEWLMGWPSGWAKLSNLEMAGFQTWLKRFCKLEK